MDHPPALAENFFTRLELAGLPRVPGEFSVVPHHQLIPRAVGEEIAQFIRVFDAVTGRDSWQSAAWREAPPIARRQRKEVCFFSAWDFHLPPAGGFELIEFNDNGSGFLFAAIINALYHQAALEAEKGIEAPITITALHARIAEMVEQEAKAFFGERPADLLLILDDAESLRQGKFRQELQLLCSFLRGSAWQAEIGCPAETRWDGEHLLFDGQRVSFIVNRSTDFFWHSGDFAGIRRAFETGRVYAAPNPFTYATRSDKRLLEWLSLPHRDDELGIKPAERQILSAHVPETHLLHAGNAEMLEQRKREFVFKPLHGFAGRGLLDSNAVGRARLRRLARQGYVAQRAVPKPFMETGGGRLWTDLRVWAYRGEIFLLSGRASRRPDRLDLSPPGGWLPTYVSI